MSCSSIPTSSSIDEEQAAQMVDLRLHNAALHSHIVRLEKRTRDLTDTVLLLLGKCQANLELVNRVVQPLAKEITY